ncbi:MAG: hypothetical protein BAJALOKI3v1_1070005 [Promethearchaeota archaeon]|jgi:hypothetical protein|nr:MAG: hypothetical protein BAJALOKI3v1_1070005 [Candidatus Lokiarchaeota archaeon]
MNRKVSKLKKLLEHWAEHNDSHKESFIKWREFANEEGLESVRKKLDKAIEKIDECSAYLRDAHREIEE